MNTNMYNHPITTIQISLLKSWGYYEIPPIEKKLACGDYGIGAMASIEEIIKKITKLLT
ncbi:hypothetical protein HZS_103 [Henneguya salminicola]|nr:hypothetical protein HZS_103 [Henneguya salminicola]